MKYILLMALLFSSCSRKDNCFFETSNYSDSIEIISYKFKNDIVKYRNYIEREVFLPEQLNSENIEFCNSEKVIISPIKLVQFMSDFKKTTEEVSCFLINEMQTFNNEINQEKANFYNLDYHKKSENYTFYNIGKISISKLFNSHLILLKIDYKYDFFVIVYLLNEKNKRILSIVELGLDFLFDADIRAYTAIHKSNLFFYILETYSTQIGDVSKSNFCKDLLIQKFKFNPFGFVEIDGKINEMSVSKIKNTEVIIDFETTDSIFLIVDSFPVFPGGEAGLKSYLKTNIKYPKHAQEHNINGTVLVKFIIERNGTISNIELLSGIGGGCDEEAIRVIKDMPLWKPGKINKINVRTEFIIPLKFSFEE